MFTPAEFTERDLEVISPTLLRWLDEHEAAGAAVCPRWRK